MLYTILAQQPEVPISETWMWQTDVQVAYAGDEDMTAFRRYPSRSFAGNIEFENETAIRRHMALMWQRHKSVLKLPLFQYQTKLKAPAAVGALGVSVNALRSDLREGQLALLIEGDIYEEVTVDTLAADAVTFVAPLTHEYSARALLCPLTIVYADNGATFSRRNPDGSAVASYRYNERDPWVPFVSPLNTAALTFFDGFAVLDQPAIGSQFDATLDAGLRVTDYVARPDVFSPYDHSKWSRPLRWQVNRALDLEAWMWWQAFADHIQGASKVFLLPSQRADFAIAVPAAGGGNTLRLSGTDYSQNYWTSDTFKRLVITSPLGRHYTKVTAVAQVGGNDVLTLAPALPAGAGWATDQTVELLAKVRNKDDRVVCDHYALHTEVAMATQTI